VCVCVSQLLCSGMWEIIGKAEVRGEENLIGQDKQFNKGRGVCVLKTNKSCKSSLSLLTDP